MRPFDSPKTLERRRRRAVALLAQGLSLREVARRVQASASSVYQWRPRKLTDQPCEPWLELLRQGARANGFPHGLWTLTRIAAVIQVQCGVRDHPAQVWKVLRRLGGSGQVPERPPIPCDEQAMAHWKRYTWPAIKKARKLGAHLAFLDESGFLLIPTRRRTWALDGHTPIIPDNDQHDRISALAALTVSPKRQPLGLSLRFQPHNFPAADVADCLRTLLRHLRGHVIRLWDRSSIHRGPAIEAVRHAHPRLPVEEFPADAPELNPTEQIWNDFKDRTANCWLRDRPALRRRLSANARRVRRSQAKLRSFIQSSKLPAPR